MLLNVLRSVRFKAAETMIDARILPYIFGVNELRDIRRKLPKLRIVTIFDVGANEGHAAAQFRRAYPSAKIHCFEPNPDLAPVLRRLGPGVEVHSIALSSSIGVAGFDRSLDTTQQFSITDDISGETVPVHTIDAFCQQRRIMDIGFLKIDTEGKDLDVLKGASNMLREGRIDLAQAEVSMNPDNSLHVDFSAVRSFIEQFGYRLFGIYEQTPEWISQRPNLRRVNAIYVSRKVIESNKV